MKKLSMAGGLLLSALFIGCPPPNEHDRDAGTHEGDAGALDDDAGTSDEDAGPGIPDAGFGEKDAGPTEPPTTYTFQSRFSDESSVAYSGQIYRHVLIGELKRFVGAITDTQYQGSTAEDVLNDLNYLYDYANAGGTGADPIQSITVDGATLLQDTLEELGGPASLKDKIAGNDEPFGNVIGYKNGDMKPHEVVQDMFNDLATLVIDRAVNANIPTDPDGNDIVKPFVTASGVDFQQLIQKFLHGAVAFHQGCDDYLDDASLEESDNTQAVDGKPYTRLEHHWDEGFGYFGAQRDYANHSDDHIATVSYFDTNMDGQIDLLSEYTFGHAQNASKRDRGSGTGDAATDFSAEAFENFIAGRHLITSAGGALSAEQMAELKGYRDAATLAWEKAIAATVVHYINDTLQDMSKFGTEDYNFLDHAKHWSEMKGFALSLQFNPRSPLSADDFAELHTLVKNAPVLPNAEQTAIDAYKGALRNARAILQEAYDFHPDNMGDDDGVGGW